MKLVERTPPPPRLLFRARRSNWARAGSYLLRLAWAWRLELATAIVVAVVANVLLSELSVPEAVVAGATMVASTVLPA